MARNRDPVPLDCKVYVGELGNSGTRHELEEAFGRYGPLKNVWVARNPPGFAFVMFEDPRDARDAVKALNGKIICGRKIRVELSSGKTRRKNIPQRNSQFLSSRGRSPSPRGRARSPRERGGRDYREERNYYYRRQKRGYSRSRSPSGSPIARHDGKRGNARNHSRTPPSRSRSRSPANR